MAYKCIDGRFDPNCDAPYDSIEDFLTMCRECFGEDEVPELREEPDGTVVEMVPENEDGNPRHQGPVILEPVES